MGNVRVVDKGFNRLMRALGEARHEHAATVGVHADEGSKAHEGDGVTVADVAVFNEFGTDSIPERSFIRAWADESRDRNHQILTKLSQAVIAGKIPSITVALNQFGALAAGDVKKRIIAHIPPPNAESTIAQKGTSTPLIGRTTQLLNAVTWKVEKK